MKVASIQFLSNNAFSFCCLALVAMNLGSAGADTLSEAHLLQGKRFAEQNKLAEALACIKEAESIARSGPEDAEYAAILNNLGEIERRLADQAGPQERIELQESAVAHLKRSIAVKEKLFGKDSLIVARALDNLGSAYMAGDANYAFAEAVFRKALEIRRQKQGIGHTDTSHELYQLGLIADALGRYADASKLLREYLTVVRRMGPSTIGVAKGQMELANSLFLQRKYADAKANIISAKAIFEKKAPNSNDCQKCRNIQMQIESEQ